MLFVYCRSMTLRAIVEVAEVRSAPRSVGIWEVEAASLQRKNTLHSKMMWSAIGGSERYSAMCKTYIKRKQVLPRDNWLGLLTLSEIVSA